MVRIDLNADLGEGEHVLPSDLAVLDVVTSANIACGFHAGNSDVMRATAGEAGRRRVAVGAHVSYRDREGFGRRPVEVAPDVLVADIVEQFAHLARVAGEVGVAVTYVKPHGALYHRMCTDPEVAGAVVAAVSACGTTGGGPPPALVALAGTAVLDLAGRNGLRPAAEAYADRAYRADGSLAPRGTPGAVLDDPAAIAGRALAIATRGRVPSVDGPEVTVAADTICLHGDTPGAATAAAAVREALDRAGVEVRTWSGPGARRDGR